MTTVALLGLPWQHYDSTSIQLGALIAFLRRDGVKVAAGHHYRDFVHYVGPQVYEALFRNSLGEAVFAAHLFPERRSAIAEMVRAKLGPEPTLDNLLGKCRSFLEDVFMSQRWERFELIGMTTTHQQLMASLCLARRIKETAPRSKVVFGGALFDETSAAGLLSLFPEVDVVVFGEGEVTLRELARVFSLPAGHQLDDVAGIAHRRMGEVVVNVRRSLIEDLESLPVPDFSDYFQRGLLPGTDLGAPRLSVEISRGCSWGRCVFCNLSTQWRGRFRQKGPERVADEVEKLVREHQSSRILFCDTNVSAFAGAFSQIAGRSLGLDVFAEVSAHLGRDDLETLRRAGVRQVQIGIESLSDRVLRQYCKGTSVMRNVEILKWCAELGIDVGYNLILNYPNEQTSDVADSLRACRFARRFAPPKLIDYSLAFDSPSFRRPDLHNIAGYRLPEIYASLYPEDVLRKIGRLIALWVVPEPAKPAACDWSPLLAVVHDWTAHYARVPQMASLLWRDSGDFLVVEDRGAPNGGLQTWRLDGLYREVYLACDRESLRVDEIAKLCQTTTRTAKAIVEELDAEGLVFFHDGRALSIAVRHA